VERPAAVWPATRTSDSSCRPLDQPVVRTDAADGTSVARRAELGGAVGPSVWPLAVRHTGIRPTRRPSMR